MHAENFTSADGPDVADDPVVVGVFEEPHAVTASVQQIALQTRLNVLDRDLPGVDGDEVCRRFVAEEREGSTINRLSPPGPEKVDPRPAFLPPRSPRAGGGTLPQRGQEDRDACFASASSRQRDG
jgi:hypothetical protein